MTTQHPPRRFSHIKFRVLIIGRANAGKTSILQRVCETTQSPTIYRRTGSNKERIQLDPSTERGEHRIEDELVFSNHDGYIFHDSRGFEAGDDNELKTVQNFVKETSRKKRLAHRLHAIWYCIPMDNQRPGLDSKYFKDICPDGNVPVIAVFTKYEQFRRNIQMHLEDHPNDDLGGNTADVAESRFQEDYLPPLGVGARFVRLEKMHKPNGRCDTLIEMTARALNDDVIALMLLAVQRSNLELSVKLAVRRGYHDCELDVEDMENIVKRCLVPFPYLWIASSDYSEGSFEALDDGGLLFLSGSEGEFFYSEYALGFSGFYSKKGSSVLKHVMASSIIQQFCSGDSRFHLILAIIMIFKKSTALLTSGSSPESSLTQAESDYQKSNIGLKVAQHFTAAPQEYSVQTIVDFIMGAFP